ncbi:STAS domain-containing protein [Bacillus sp. FJAT-45037]|uniref:STAS domain-containing protein n=1 Tax=Bacillus sp. FJAT-45037 TaxID=2011007 RepID=UPI000C23523D|nr:STAS domain-containing protein [Bacillus sp. FJAT-45037]
MGIQKMSQSGSELTIVLDGNIYVEEATSIRDQVYPFLQKGCHSFWFDMKHVEYIDSAGLGVLVTLHKRATENGGTVKVSNVSRQVKKMLELTRLQEVFEIES